MWRKKKQQKEVKNRNVRKDCQTSRQSNGRFTVDQMRSKSWKKLVRTTTDFLRQSKSRFTNFKKEAMKTPKKGKRGEKGNTTRPILDFLFLFCSCHLISHFCHVLFIVVIKHASRSRAKRERKGKAGMGWQGHGARSAMAKRRSKTSDVQKTPRWLGVSLKFAAVGCAVVHYKLFDSPRGGSVITSRYFRYVRSYLLVSLWTKR